MNAPNAMVSNVKASNIIYVTTIIILLKQLVLFSVLSSTGAHGEHFEIK